MFTLSILRGDPQVRGDFRSTKSGPWNSALTWERFDGTAWISADRCPDSSAGIISVRSSHSVTIATALVYDQVVVERDAQVTVAAGVSHTLADGPGNDLTIDGTWLNQGSTWTILGSARWMVNDGGGYIHNTTAGIATPLSKSILSKSGTFVYRGGLTLIPASSFSGRSYGNLCLESTGGSFTLSASGSGALMIAGDLTIGVGVKWNTAGFTGNITIEGTTSIGGEWGGSGSGSQGVHTFGGHFSLQVGGKYTPAATGSPLGNLMFKGDVTCLSSFIAPTNRVMEFCGSSRQTIDAPARITFSNGATARRGLIISAGSTVEVGSQKHLVLHGDLDLSGTIVGRDSASYVLLSDSCRSFVNNGSVLIPVRFDSTVADRHISGAGIWNAILVERICTLHVSGSHTLLGERAPLNVLGTVIFETGSVVAYRGRTRQELSPQLYYDITIDNPEGIRLSGPTVVDGRLEIRNGMLSTGGYLLKLGPNGTLDEAGANKVLGSIISVRRLVAGKVEDFGNIGISIRSESFLEHDFAVTRRTDTAWVIARSRPIRRSFMLAPTTILWSATISFRYDPSELNGVMESGLQLYGSADGGADWTRLGGSVDASTHTISYSGDGSSCLMTLAEPFQPPDIASVSPAVVEQGSTIDLIISGSGFKEGVSILSVSGSGVKVNSIVVRGDTVLVANISVDVAAPLGGRDICLEAPGGDMRSLLAFEIVKASNPVPQLTSIAPSNGARLESHAITFHGSGFVEGVTSASLGEGIAVTGYVLDPSILVVYASIEEDAGLGSRDVTVVNSAPGGGVATLPGAFNVVNPMPRITSVSPRKVALGDCLEIEVVGANFLSGITSLDFGKGIVLDSLRVVSHVLMKARIRVEFSVGRGSRPVAAINRDPGGGRGTLINGFVITDPPPRILSIAPAMIPRGSCRSIDISGSGFVSSGMILSLGSGMVVDSMWVLDSCRLRASIFAPRSAQPGPRDIVLANCGPDGESTVLRGALVIVNPLPVITRADPPLAARGQSAALTVSGSDLFPDATTLDLGPGVKVKSCIVDSAGEQLSASISVAFDAEVGQRDVRVTNSSPGGGEAVLLRSFAVVNPVPSLVSVKPASGGRGGSLDITLTGSNFFPGATSVSLSPGVTTDFVAVLSPSLLRARISISPTAIVGARTVVVTNAPPGGGVTRLMHVFNVENALPVVDGVEPKVLLRGDRLTLAVRGSGFSPEITDVDLGGGIVIESTNVVSSSLLEVTLSVSVCAEVGVRDVRVTNGNPGGGEALMRSAFAVHNPLPQVETIDPRSAGTGKALSVMLSGRGFLQGVTSIDLGEGIEVDTLAVKNSSVMQASIRIHPVTRAGLRSVKVSNPGPGGGIALLRDAFSVIAPLPSAAESDGTEVPDHPVLVGVYPNPFNHAVTVMYGLPVRSIVRIVVCNILGVEIAEVLHQARSEGYHTVRWTSTREPSGIYFVRMVVESEKSASRFATSRKLVLLK